MMAKPVLPSRVVEILLREFRRSHTGHPVLSGAAMRALDGTLRPHEVKIALCLAPGEHRGGAVHLQIPRHVDFKDAHLPDNQYTVEAEYNPSTGRWISEVASGRPGLSRFAGHVWRVKGAEGEMPERRMLALIGLAYLRFLEEQGGDA
jgi:hypothetical protein